MQAVILAGGLGTRLKSVINDKPKPMAQFEEKPIIEYIIEQVKEHVDEIVILIGYKGQVIKDYFGDGSKWGIKINYSSEPTKLGTGGALKNAQNKITDDFILINGDNYHELPYAEYIKNFKKTNTNTMILTPTQNPTQVTIVEIDNKGKITGLKERPIKPGPEDQWMNAGILLLKKDTIKLIPPGKSKLSRDTFPKLVQQGMRTEKYNGYYIDIGTPENYQKFKKHAKNLKEPNKTKTT